MYLNGDKEKPVKILSHLWWTAWQEVTVTSYTITIRVQTNVQFSHI